MRSKLLTAIAAVAAIGGQALAETPEPKYEVVIRDGDIEIRDYAPMIVAEVVRRGERDDAINAGFTPLADYIFGENEPNAKIAMTAPVTQEIAGEEIAMTAPVTQEASGDGIWRVRFVMPAQYSLESLPKPKNGDIKVIEVPGERRAVIRFSGFGSDSALHERTAELKAFIATHGAVAVGEPIYAFYDPPWTLPFFRRNEVMWRLETR